MKQIHYSIIALIIVICLAACANTAEEPYTVETASAVSPSVADHGVWEYFSSKYDMTFQLWSAQEDSLFAYYVYPDYADWECHILMPANTDDVAQYQKNLTWEVVGDELIISGAGAQEAFKIDITLETATSTSTGRVYQIYAME